MSESSISEVARCLIAARRDHRQWDASDAAPLNDAGEAYAVQDLVTGGLDADLGGWKTSAPDPRSVPIAAPIYSALLHRTGTQIPASELFVIGKQGFESVVGPKRCSRAVRLSSATANFVVPKAEEIF